jgi:hypothetical protein
MPRFVRESHRSGRSLVTQQSIARCAQGARPIPGRIESDDTGALAIPCRSTVLELRAHCECCGKDLLPEAADAMICSFECTFCADCVRDRLHGTCPNCGGGFERRPRRSSALLEKYPASTTRRARVRTCAN